ncbi:MAG: MurR/RpiR family transcriptional regulator [Coprobacillaceae bacterium]
MVSNHLKSDLYNRLSEFLFNTHKFSNDFFIAKVMLEKLSSFPDVSLDEVAYLANTTGASVTKFCQKLGYQGFIDLKNDTFQYADNSLSNILFINDEASVKDSINNFITFSNTLLTNMFNAFDEEQILRITKKIKRNSKITIFSNIYGIAASRLVTELMIPFNITVYEIERKSELEVIKEILHFSDLVFVISLSGTWAINTFNNTDITNEELDKVVVLNHSNTISIPFFEIVSLSNVGNFYTSSLITNSALQAFFVLLAIHLNKNIDN